MHLALTISDHQASAKPKDISRQFDADAEMLAYTGCHVSGDTSGTLQA
jgi:hypothetical protein